MQGKKGQGAITFVSIIVLLLIFILVFAFINRTTSEARWVNRILRGEVATQLAESMIDEAIWYVRSQMNTPGKLWFDKFRQPGKLPIVQEYVPKITINKIVKEDYNPWGQPDEKDFTVQIKFTDIQEFTVDNPCPVNTEKMGTLQITAAVKFRGIEKKVTVCKNIKIVDLSPPPPLDKYTVWIKNEGKISRPDDFDPALSLEPLPAEDKTKINRWEYLWQKTPPPVKGFPFCRYKVSHYFKTLADFKKAFFRNGTYYLDGIILIGDTAPSVIFSGTVKNKGAIFTRHSKIIFNNYGIMPGDSFINLVALSSDIQVTGDTNFEGAIYAPKGQLISGGSFNEFNGPIYTNSWPVKKWVKPGIRFANETSRERICVTMSNQITLWREE